MLNGNLFADIPAELPEEVVQILVQSHGVRVERIISKGQSSPEGFWYDQDLNEFVVLLTGAAKVHIAGETEERLLNPGEYILLEKHLRHRVTWTTPEAVTVWLAVFFE